MRIVATDNVKEFVIGDYINSKTFLFACVCDEQEYCRNLLEKELNKPFDTICIDDSKIISDFVLSLNETEKLYLIMGLLANYDLSKTDSVSLAIEKVMKDYRIEKYCELIMTILNSVLLELEEERLSAKEKVEKFEKENNITILIEK